MDEAKKREVEQLNLQVGRRLRDFRECNGYTQEQFAETLNISVVHYRKLEGGKYRLQNENTVKLYETYHIDPTYLLTGKSSKVFDPDLYFANCTGEERVEVFGRMFTYIMNIISKNGND